MPRHTVPAICASSAVAFGLALMTHESAHAVAGWLAGGSPTLVTALEVRGDFSTLSPFGFALLGASGSVVNLFWTLGAWRVLGRARAIETRLVAWFVLAVNGFLITTKVLGESAAGFGDLMTILRPFPGVGIGRIVAAAAGLAGIVIAVRVVGGKLGTVIPSGDRSSRAAEAYRIVVIGGLVALVMAVGAGMTSPVGASRGMLLATGACLGAVVPMVFAARVASRSSRGYSGRMAEGRWPWMVSAVALTLVLWIAFGPGIDV